MRADVALHNKAVAGRKSYQCAWCGQRTEVGEKHHHYVGYWEGDWQDWRMHLECYEAWNEDWHDGFEYYVHQRGSLDESA